MKRNSFRYKGSPTSSTQTIFTGLLGGLANFSQMHIKIHLARPTDFHFFPVERGPKQMAGCKNKRQTKRPTIKKATTYDISKTNVKTGLIRVCNVTACTERNCSEVAKRLWDEQGIEMCKEKVFCIFILNFKFL